MPTRRDDDRPKMWATKAQRNNVVVLTDAAVYLATVPAKGLPKVDLGLEEGEAAEDLLGKYTKVRLKRITAFQYRQSKMFAIADLTLFHDEGDVERKTVLSFGLPGNRAEFITELRRRLGNWPATEEVRSPAVTLLKYVAILSVVLLGTAVLALAEWQGWITAGPSIVILCLDLCGVWGVLGFGTLLFMLVFAIGIRELAFDPIRIITHDPGEEE
jgi:hypothetical protein